MTAKKKTGHDDSADLRKRAEEALAKSEALLREAQRAAHIGHWELDTSIMTPAWSEEIFHIFGLDPEEGEPSFEAHQKVTHPDDWDILNNAVTTSIVEGTPFDIEFRILRPDKAIRWMHAIGYPKKDREGRIVSVFGTAQDITDRKSMEDVLRVSLEKYRVLFESFPLGITISDKSGKIMEGNRQSEKLLGINREAHAQRRIDSKEWQIIRKDGTPMPADEYASTRALRENRLIENVEMGIVHDKDEITWISVTAAPIPLEGYGVAITYGDITERKRAEKEIQSLARFPAENPEPVLRIARDGTLLYINQAGLNLLPEWHLQVGKATPLKLREVALQVLDNGSTRRLDLEHLRQIYSFSVVPVVDAGYANLYARDVTERRKAEEALRESKEFAENLIASMQDGFSVLDSDGVQSDVNAAFCQMTGFSREELIGVGLPHPYWPPEAYEEIRKGFQETLRGEFNDVELTFMRKNGERFPVIVSPSWVQDKQGNVVSYFATVKDITERKRAEEEKRRLEERSRKIVEDIFRFIPEGVLVFSRKMELLRQNQAFRELVSGYAGRLGFAEDELENLIIDKIKAGLGDENIKEIKISRKHETGK
jgi:PAS domain S-box-containing protein